MRRADSSTSRLPSTRQRTLPEVAAVAQGAYYVATGVWPFVSMRSFLAVTGPKADLWLVKTVGGLVGVVGSALLLGGLRRRVTPELTLLGAGSAAALGAIESVYAYRRRISPVYLADALVEAALLAAWATARPAPDSPRHRPGTPVAALPGIEP